MHSQESVGARAAFALDIPLISISYILLALIALLPRVLSLGSFVTVDEIAFWIPRSEAFLRAIQAGDFPATAISTHPGVTTMWLGSAGVVQAHFEVVRRWQLSDRCKHRFRAELARNLSRRAMAASYDLVYPVRSETPQSLPSASFVTARRISVASNKLCRAISWSAQWMRAAAL